MTRKKTGRNKRLRSRSRERKVTDNKVIVIDTCVLIHDQNSLLKFGKHDIHVSSVVLNELDDNKRNGDPKSIRGEIDESVDIPQISRIAIHSLSRLTKNATVRDIKSGIRIWSTIDSGRRDCYGRLFLNMSKPKIPCPKRYQIDWDYGKNDHKLIMYCLQLMEKYKKVLLVTRDISLITVAKTIGVNAQFYSTKNLRSLKN